jgi:hypothetical protein
MARAKPGPWQARGFCYPDWARNTPKLAVEVGPGVRKPFDGGTLDGLGGRNEFSQTGGLADVEEEFPRQAPLGTITRRNPDRGGQRFDRAGQGDRSLVGRSVDSGG